MALKDLLDLTESRNRRKVGVSEERLAAIIPTARQYIAFWREYPDLFLDYLQTGGGELRKDQLNLYFYQRVFIRVCMRYRYVYAVFPRAYSKSFLSVLTMMLRAILYPGLRQFSAAGGKEQSASILQEKVEEICALVPAFEKEIDRRPGKTRMGKDMTRYVFKGGSIIDNLAASEKSRGKRRHGGLLEECVGIDGKILQEVLIPTMNVSRRCKDGTVQEGETPNKSQIFITTAGYKGTFAYEKLIQVLVQMITEPGKAFIMGGTYRVPVAFKLIDKNFVQDLKKDSTFNEAGFEREYESKWTGTVEGAFFDGDKFDRNRILQKPEYENSGRSSKLAYYVLAVDVGRKGCQTIVTVFKVTPRDAGGSLKSVVNIYDYEDLHFEDQAIQIKKLYYKYKANRIVIDGNGLGIGLVDYMVKSQTDKNGDIYPDFGVYNDEEGYYKKYKTDNTEFDAMYIIKANAPINTEAYATVRAQLESGRVKFLIEEKLAKAKLLDTSMGQKMTPEKRGEYLKPYVMTSVLKEEMLNLREENEGINIILKQANKGIRKDKFSSLCYGLYYIKLEEDRKKKKKKKFNAKEWQFMN